jgi:hypothetical protein
MGHHCSPVVARADEYRARGCAAGLERGADRSALVGVMILALLIALVLQGVLWARESLNMTRLTPQRGGSGSSAQVM